MIENDDRKPNNYNLVLKPIGTKFKITPIDHAFIFSTIQYKDLNPKYVAVSTNDHLLVSELGHLIKQNIRIDKNFINSDRKYFYLCLSSCEQNFDSYINQLKEYYSIDEASISNLKSFLFNKERNNKVFEEYVYRLNQ